MNWEKGPRTVPGYYWLYRSYSSRVQPHTLLVHLSSYSGRQYINFIGTDEDQDGGGKEDDWFLGPLEIPKPPEVNNGI